MTRIGARHGLACLTALAALSLGVGTARADDEVTAAPTELPKVQGTWKLPKDKGAEYFSLEPLPENRFAGKRLKPFSYPELPQIGTALSLTLGEGNKLTGSLTFIDQAPGGRWRPKSAWEMTLKGKDKMEGRSEQIFVDFEAETQEGSVTERTWKDRMLVRLQRFGGDREFLSKVELAEGPDAGKVSPKLFGGDYATADGRQATIAYDGEALTLKLGKNTYSLKAADGILKGRLEGAPVDCAIELVVTDKGLAGRIAWKDFDPSYVTYEGEGEDEKEVKSEQVIRSGWSPIELEKLVRSGPAPVKSEPARPTGGSATVAELGGRWLLDDGRTIVTAVAAGEELFLKLPTARLSGFRLNDGVLTATETRGTVVLQWELTATKEKLHGRRQWALHRNGSSEVLGSGWVPVALHRLKLCGPEPQEDSIEAPAANTDIALDAIAGDWLMSSQGRFTGKAEGEMFQLDGEAGKSFTFKLEEGLLVFTETVEGQELRWELRPSADELRGRRQWKEVDMVSGEVHREGWVPVAFRRSLHLGPAKEDKPAPTPSPSSSLTLEGLAGTWMTPDDQRIQATLEGGRVAFTGWLDRPMRFALEKGLLVGKQLTPEGVVLAWEGTVKDGVFYGRREWKEITSDFRKDVVDSGWVGFTLTRLEHYGPAPSEADAPAPPPLPEGFRLEEFAGEFLMPAGGSANATVDGAFLTLAMTGGATVELAMKDGLLRGREKAGLVELDWEMSYQSGRLMGRRQWLDRLPTGKLVKQGWNAVSLERLKVIGTRTDTDEPAPTATEAPATLPADALDALWAGPNGELMTVSASGADVLFNALEGGAVWLATKYAAGVLSGARTTADGVERKWELVYGSTALVGRRQWVVWNEAKGEAHKTGWEAVALTRLPRLGVKAGEDAIPTDRVEPAEDAAGSLSGSWKLGSGNYLTLKKDGESGYTGKLKIGKTVTPVTLTVDGKVARGKATWTSGETSGELGIEVALPSKGASTMRVEWADWNPATDKPARSGWSGHSLKKLRRFG